VTAHLPGESAGALVFAFRQGLAPAIARQVAYTVPAPATLEATVALAAGIEAAHGQARAAGAEGVNSLDAGHGSDDARVVTRADLNAIVADAVAKGMAAGAAQRMHMGEARPPNERRVDGGANKRPISTPVWQRVGLTEAEGKRRYSEDLCMHCAQKGHRYRDCKQRAEGKPARTN
jgi:hypothetical protein